MLELLTSGVINLWLDLAGVKTRPENLLVWQQTTQFVLPGQSEKIEKILQPYLADWDRHGLGKAQQGVWIQSGYEVLASNQGDTPLPAASLTKIATTLAALKTWHPHHQFETKVCGTGPVRDGVLQGDLVVSGDGDPFFIWSEALALGVALNKKGITRVTGNLLISDKFSMNYESDLGVAGKMLFEAMNPKLWSWEIKNSYWQLPPDTPQPQVKIDGLVLVPSNNVPDGDCLLRRKSMPLMEILKQMNVHSNNELSEAIAVRLGGAAEVRKLAAQATGIPIEEIQLVNGSGLGEENRISARAAVAMLMAIQQELTKYQLNIADFFPVAGRDRGGTLWGRLTPTHTVAKTGTLRHVSSLAGVLPTRDRGLVWFAIVNRGWDLHTFRAQQDRLLQELVSEWGVAPALPEAIDRHVVFTGDRVKIGALGRNEIF